jgi:hypothetical protein
MHFERALVAALLERDPGQAGEPGGFQGGPQRRARLAVARGIDIGLAQVADKRAAADEVTPMRLLVGIGADIDRQAAAGEFERAHDAEHAVEPTGMVLRLDMAAGEQVRAGPAMPPEHVADAVDGGVEPGLGHAGHQPVPAFHVLRAEGRAVHASPVGADGSQGVEILHEPVCIDLHPRALRW